MVKRALLAALFLVIYFSNPQNVFGTVVVGSTLSDSTHKVNVNYFVNHDYIAQYRPMFFARSVDALAVARDRLVNTNKLEDIPILIIIPSGAVQTTPNTTEISKKSNCEITYGDSGYPPNNIGKCYKIHYLERDSYANFLSLLASLTQLTSVGQKLVINNIEVTKTNFHSEISALQNIVKHYYPVWSPDGRHLVYTKVEDGVVNHIVNNVEGVKIETLNIQGTAQVSTPLWSSDSRYVSIASLDSILVYDTSVDKIVNINLPDYEGSANLETLISFDTARDKLLIAFDTNLLDRYELLEYDFKTGQMITLASDLYRPTWPHIPSADDYLKALKATSPDGKHEAVIDNESATTIPVVNNLITESKQKVGVPSEVKKVYKSKTSSNLIILGGVSLVSFVLVAILILLKLKKKPKM